MSQKAHGTTEKAVMKPLRFGVDWGTANYICSFTRSDTEYDGYAFASKLTWVNECNDIRDSEMMTYYDSVSGKPLFVAPKRRNMEAFMKESKDTGRPCFRDDEVVWENMRCLPDGEAVSVDGTHLGHNKPDSKGNRYCINLVSVAGNPYEKYNADKLFN